MCLQTISEWNPQKACKVIGDVHQKVLRNLQIGRCTEKVLDTVSEPFLYIVGSTKVVTANANQIQVQNRWNLKEEASSFDITRPPHQIAKLEINEPYLIAVISNNAVIVWDLEKKRKIFKFLPLSEIVIGCVYVKCNGDVLITSYSHNLPDTLLTVRQVPCDAHPETDFPVIEYSEFR